MVLLGINKRPTEYKEVDDKDWIRESYENSMNTVDFQNL